MLIEFVHQRQLAFVRGCLHDLLLVGFVVGVAEIVRRHLVRGGVVHILAHVS